MVKCAFFIFKIYVDDAIWVTNIYVEHTRDRLKNNQGILINII